MVFLCKGARRLTLNFLNFFMRPTVSHAQPIGSQAMQTIAMQHTTNRQRQRHANVVINRRKRND